MALVHAQKRLEISPPQPAFGKLLKSVREVVHGAKQAAIEIRNEAEVMANDERERLCKEGYNHGVSLALKELWQQKKEVQASLTSARDEILSLSVKFAEELIGEQIITSEGFLNRIDQAIAHCLSEKRCVLCLHPEDLPGLRESVLARYGTQIDLTFETDHKLKRGDARLETEAGTIETSISNQLLALAHQLHEKEICKS